MRTTSTAVKHRCSHFPIHCTTRRNAVEDEIVIIYIMLLPAGYETTTNMIGNGASQVENLFSMTDVDVEVAPAPATTCALSLDG